MELMTKQGDDWVLNFGRHKGKLLSQVVEHDSRYLNEYVMCSSYNETWIAPIVDDALKERERKNAEEWAEVRKAMDEAMPPYIF